MYSFYDKKLVFILQDARVRWRGNLAALEVFISFTQMLVSAFQGYSNNVLLLFLLHEVEEETETILLVL